MGLSVITSYSCAAKACESPTPNTGQYLCDTCQTINCNRNDAMGLFNGAMNVNVILLIVASHLLLLLV